MPRVVTSTVGDLLRDTPVFTSERIDRRRRRLSAIVGEHADRSRPFLVSVQKARTPLAPLAETVRLRREWKDTIVGAGDVVTIVYLPRGGGGQGGMSQGKQIGMAVAAIALAVVATIAAGPLAGAMGFTAGTAAFTVATTLIQAGIVLGGTALVPLGSSHPKRGFHERLERDPDS